MIANCAPTPARATVAVLGWGERVSRQLITEYRSELDRIHALDRGSDE
jgi:hypothetical protein